MHILVVGGGVIGVATAFELQLRGHSVELFEARNELALETSHANGGMLTAGMCEPWNAPGVWKDLLKSFSNPDSPMKLHLSAVPTLAVWGLRFLAQSAAKRFERNTIDSCKLCQYSVKKTNELVNEQQINCDYRSNFGEATQTPKGDLKIFESASAASMSIALSEMLAPLGLRTSRLNQAEVLELEPALLPIADQIHSGLYFPDDASGDAARFTQELASRFIALGGVVHYNSHVQSLTDSASGVRGLTTQQGSFSGDSVVVAAASASTRLLKQQGVNLPIKPVKGYSLTLDATNIEGMPRTPVINQAMHAAINPLGNRIRVAGTAEFTADTKPVIDQSRVDNLRKLLEATYPLLAENLDFSRSVPWCGFRPMSADGKPFIGSTKKKNLYVNCGHGYLGWTQAVGSASLLADIMTNQSPAIDGSPYSADR